MKDKVKSITSGSNSVVVIIIGISLFLCLCCCACFAIFVLAAEDKDSGITISESGGAEEDVAEPAVEEPKIYKIGDKIELDESVLEVVSFEKDYKNSRPEYVKPKAGNKFVAVEVKVTNNDDKNQIVGSYDFKMKDEEDFAYSSTYLDPKDPQLSSKTLQPGESIRGWLTYEVPSDADEFFLTYTSGLWSSQQVIVKVL